MAPTKPPAGKGRKDGVGGKDPLALVESVLSEEQLQTVSKQVDLIVGGGEYTLTLVQCAEELRYFFQIVFSYLKND
jgi:hypothetical protein